MMRILFVDDEPRILDGLRDLLRRHRRKWDMVFAVGGEAALQQLAAREFDVVVTDMRMPGIDGAALLARVKELYPQVVRIVLSGYSELEATLRAVPVAHQFLTKPTSAEELENVIERSCGLQTLLTDESLRRAIGSLQTLPSLSSVYMDLTRVLANERSGARDVAAVLESDPAMSAKLLQLVNNAFLGLGRRISSVESAVSYLGFNMIRNVALSAEIFGTWSASQMEGFELEAFQTHCICVAELASHVVGANRRLAEDAFTAGMLHDIGVLLLAVALPQRLEQVFHEARQTCRPLPVVEREILGTSHAELGAYLLGIWGLPHPIVEAVAYHHEPHRVSQPRLDVLAGVHIANALVGEIEGREDPHVARPEIDPKYLESIGAADLLEEWRALAEEIVGLPNPELSPEAP